MEKNYYTILEVDQKASPEVIKGAYRALLKNAGHHPDLGGNSAHAQQITEAYSVLSNPATRREYDSLLTFSPPLDVELPEVRFVLICPSCGTRNQLKDEKEMEQAMCQACDHRLVPRRRPARDDDHERAFRLGLYLLDKGLHDRALREFRTAVRVKPRNGNYQYWLGRCLYNKRDFKGAGAAFQTAARIDPEQFHFQFWLGQSAYALRKFSDAGGYFARATKLRPDHPPTLMKLSSCLFRLREYEQAIAALEAAIKAEPTSMRPHLWLGLSHLARKDATAALDAFHAAERLSPGNPLAKKYIRLCEAS